MTRISIVSVIYLLLLQSLPVQAQHTYLPLGSDEYHQLDRIEGWFGENNPYMMTSLKPYTRWDAYEVMESVDEQVRMLLLTTMPQKDVYNIKRFKDLNGEWGKGNYTYDDATPRREKPFLRYFYSTAQHMLLWSDEDYFVSVNPVLHLQGALDEYSEDLGFINRRGVEARARLFNKIGIYTTISDNQERVPRYINSVGDQWKAYPGYSEFTKSQSSRPYDAFYARGYINFPIYQDYINATFGFDKNFIGDGIRSMILSDQSGPYTFLRLRYQVGRFYYQNLFMELMKDYKGALDLNRPKKYASIHYLGFKLSPKVDLALVETNNYNDEKISSGLFVPIILARTAQRFLDNDEVYFRNSLAFTSKIVWTRNLMTYTQLNVQNVDFKNKDSWKQQWAYQVGLKYFNVANIKHLDAQIEWNGATPFMYSSSSDLQTNFTHYNQPLAHHLESAFSEWIVKLQYQVINPLQLETRFIYSTGSNYGSNNAVNGASIFQLNTDRLNIPYKIMGDGNFNSYHFMLAGQYEFFPNMFVDAGVHYVHSTSKIDAQPFSNIMLYTGIRINALKRLYDWNL